jgi:hypothetical protein
MRKFIYTLCAMALMLCAAFSALADTGQASFDCELSQSVQADVDSPVVAVVANSSGFELAESAQRKVTDNYSISEPNLALNTVVAEPLERYDKQISISL